MPGHQTQEYWMGQTVTTLADLWPANPKAVIVGINPAPISVDIGHYYQGRLGQLLFTRLRTAGILAECSGWEDDAAVRSGIGFTDIVKRPSTSATAVGNSELLYGRDLLLRKLEVHSPPLVIFAFKKSAIALLGNFRGNGILTHKLGQSRLFVMPGPYESNLTATPTLAQLTSIWSTIAG